MNRPIGVNLYLCELDANGYPVLPGLDSIERIIYSSSSAAPVLLGGSFSHSNLPTPRTMTTSFAVLFRNMSGSSGDTVRLCRTNGATSDNMAANPNQRCADVENGKDYGYIMYNKNFYSSRDFSLHPGFGLGTQFEFLVAPRVTYTLQASQILPPHVTLLTDLVTKVDTACTREEMVFTNTSSKFYEHRMYNLNQFYRKWNLYSAFPIAPPGGFSADSSITWKFEFRDIDGRNDRVFLPYVNNGTIKIATDLASTPASPYPDCFVTNQFRARLKPMAAFGAMPQLEYNENFKICTKFCFKDAVGIKNLSGISGMNAYPNPAVNGKTMISGLEGKNSVMVYDLLGVLIKTEVTSSTSTAVDLSKYPAGTYLVRVVNADNASKTIRIVNQH